MWKLKPTDTQRSETKTSYWRCIYFSFCTSIPNIPEKVIDYIVPIEFSLLKHKVSFYTDKSKEKIKMFYSSLHKTQTCRQADIKQTVFLDTLVKPQGKSKYKFKYLWNLFMGIFFRYMLQLIKQKTQHKYTTTE